MSILAVLTDTRSLNSVLGALVIHDSPILLVPEPTSRVPDIIGLCSLRGKEKRSLIIVRDPLRGTGPQRPPPLPVSLCALRSRLATNHSLRITHGRSIQRHLPFAFPPLNPRVDSSIQPGRRYATRPAVDYAAVVLGFGYPAHGDPEINAFCGGLLLRSSVSIQVDNDCQR